MKSWALISWTCFATACSSLALTNKVLIIGIDGTMPSALAVARTPNLNALTSNGCYSVRAVTHPVTHSAACWASMFTGVWGDKHLVNDPNNSFTGNNFAQYPSFFKRLENANTNLNTLCFARWSPLLTVVPEADVKLAFNSDAEITAETCRRLTNSNPDVFYMILLDVDSAGHTYGWGPTVSNYVSAIETADVRVGQIMSALRARATYTNEDWLVIALTDHGQHDNPDLEKSRITWHIISGPSAARGVMWPSPAIVDVCATVLRHMGIPIALSWNLDGRAEGFPLRPTTFGSNLIFNGDAEYNSGTGNYATNRGIAWWFDVSSTTLGIYGGNGNFPGPASPGPGNRGSNFFLGGTTSSVISQRIDVSAVAAGVDANEVRYNLSGWFGGAGFDGDSARLATAFLDSGGALLQTVVIGGTTASDRGGVTGMLEHNASDALPVGTRFVEFTLTNSVVTGNNDASADNLSFVLSRVEDPPFQIDEVAKTAEGCRVTFTGITNRVYSLSRSEDLVLWSDVAVLTNTSAGPVSMIDTNASPERAFYRVQRFRP